MQKVCNAVSNEMDFRPSRRDQKCNKSAMGYAAKWIFVEINTTRNASSLQCGEQRNGFSFKETQPEILKAYNAVSSEMNVNPNELSIILHPCFSPFPLSSRFVLLLVVISVVIIVHNKCTHQSRPPTSIPRASHVFQNCQHDFRL